MEVIIDATEYVARFKMNTTTNVGIDYMGYK